MNDLAPAQASAQFISLIVLVTMVRWYIKSPTLQEARASKRAPRHGQSAINPLAL